MAPIKDVGFWGPVTSTLDWCEENYVVSTYIAEFWNTISNLVMIVPPLLGCVLCYQYRYELRHFMCLALLTVVGIGSLCFHATLLYEMQLLDELPMIYGTCSLIFAVADCGGTKVNTKLIVSLIATSIAITIIYVNVKDPLIFQWCYGLLVAMLVVLEIHSCWRHNASAALLGACIASYLTGFILWNVDNNFCPQVREFRQSLQSLAQPFTQLHMWWHTLAGIGTYGLILYIIDLRCRCKGKISDIRLAWNWLPFMFIRESGSSPGTQKTMPPIPTTPLAKNGWVAGQYNKKTSRSIFSVLKRRCFP